MLLLRIILILLFLSQLLRAEVLRVPEDYTLIQEAVNSAASGDTVLLARGTYTELLQLPQRDLTLTSNHLFSRDTADINETILDGEYQGTILSALDGPHRTLRVHGFTIMRGLGFYSTDSGWRGGAIQVADTMSLTVEDTYFTENAAPFQGALINLYSRNRRFMRGDLTLCRLKISNNDNLEGVSQSSHLVYRGHYGKCRIEDIHIADSDGYTKMMWIRSSDSMFVHGIVVEGIANLDGDVFRLSTLYENSYIEARDILFRNNSLDGGSISIGVADGTMHLTNIQFIDNDLLTSGLHAGADTLIADSIIYINNHDRSNILGSSLQADYYGLITNLVMRDNTIGSFGFYNYELQRMLTTTCSIRGALFENNTFYLQTDPNVPHSPTTHGTILDSYQQPTDSAAFITLENAIFRNNFHDNPADYSDPQTPLGAMDGRILYYSPMSTTPNDEGVPALKHCLFENNRQPNICPDVPYMAGTSGGVGSIISVNGSPYSHVHEDVLFEDVTIRDNDDGAILMEEVDRVTINNLQIIDTPRRGLAIMFSEEVSISNLFISGVVQQAQYHPPPYDWCEHAGLTVVAEDTCIIRNSTIVNCNLPYILNFGCPPSSVWPVMENCLIVDNQYDDWHKTSCTSDLPVIDYSLLEHEVEGFGNMFMVDPQFDPELGPPYLASTSPCIDAGNPDPAQNDPENPVNPGVPLWPAQGTLRNDIGFTGGPGAMVQEFEGVSRKPIVHQQPVSALLHQNYPNPFNPTTTIEFELQRPMEVRLTVYNLLGEQVTILTDGLCPAGIQQVHFDGGNLASGVYIYRLEAGEAVQARKMLLVR